MSQPSRTARTGLPRTDLRQQARLRSLAVAASAASTGWMAAALADVTEPPALEDRAHAGRVRSSAARSSLSAALR